MSDDDSTTSQLRFNNGDLVGNSTNRGVNGDGCTTTPIEPEDGSGFDVEAKSGALEVNSQLREDVTSHGDILTFESQQHAETYVDQLSATGGSLRIQAVPENEPKAIDAYLLADHTPSIKEPASVDGDTWTFDVGANLYGTLGEAILLQAPKPHALIYFVRDDLNLDDEDLEEGLHVDIDRGQLVAIERSTGPKRWVPDCIIEARDGWDGNVLGRYYCEIKTGNASFERSQVEVMETLASSERVLKIRVLIENLPDQYSLRIEGVESP